MALTDDLVALWEFEEASGTREDSVGDIDLSPADTPGSETGIIGDGILLSGAVGQYVQNSGTAHPWAGVDDLTISFWYNPDTPGTGEQNVFRIDAGGVLVARGRLLNASGVLEVVMRDDGGTLRTRNNGTPDADTWTNVVIRYVRDDAMYVSENDGTPLSTATVDEPFSSNTSTPTFTVGASNAGNQRFDGTIDQLAIWTRALTDDEVTELYNGGEGTSLQVSAFTYNYANLDLGNIGFRRSWSS